MEQIILAVNTAGTLAIGSMTFIIVYTTFKGLQDEKLQKFSKRFLLVISFLLLYTSYLTFYNQFYQGNAMAQYPMYIILVMVFISLIYASAAFEGIANQFGVSQEKKLEKMEKEELGK